MIDELHTVWTALLGSPVLRWVAIFAILNFIGSYVPYFRARKIQPGIFRWKQVAVEVVLITIAGALGVFFLGAFTVWLKSQGWVHADPSAASWWAVLIEFAIFFVLFDMWFYWNHRLMHIEPIYTLVHRWHHQSLTPTVVSTVNVNPLESLINGGFVPAYVSIAYLTGNPVHEASMPFIGGSTFLIGVWIHCGFEFLPRWWNKTWATKGFIASTFHDQHHQYFRFNYGGFSTVWDRICGTMRPKYEADFASPRARMLEQKRNGMRKAQKPSGGAGRWRFSPFSLLARDGEAAGGRKLVEVDAAITG
ncbi:MAG: sterol desaturase family protein [Novosphingobium sp.]